MVTFTWTWPRADWIKSCALGGDLCRRVQAQCRRELLWLKVWHIPDCSVSAQPLAVVFILFSSCPDCKIFLMTGHILHLDFMVTTTSSFLFSLVEVMVTQSWGEISVFPKWATFFGIMILLLGFLGACRTGKGKGMTHQGPALYLVLSFHRLIYFHIALVKLQLLMYKWEEGLGDFSVQRT